MKYFDDGFGGVHAFDDADESQITLMRKLAIGWTDITDSVAAGPIVKTKHELLSLVSAELTTRWRAGFPVSVNGVEKWFHSDEFSLVQHIGLKDRARDLLAAGGVMSDVLMIAGQPVSWSTMDGSLVAITAQTAFDIVESASIQQAAIFASSKAHVAAINAANDLTSYDVKSGWPTVFSDLP